MLTFVDKNTAKNIIDGYTVHHKPVPVLAEEYDVSRAYVMSLLQGKIPAFKELAAAAHIKGAIVETTDLNVIDFTKACEALAQGLTTTEALAKDLGVKQKDLVEHLQSKYRVKLGVRGREAKVEIPERLIEALKKGERSMKSVAQELGCTYPQLRASMPEDFVPTYVRHEIPFDKLQEALDGKVSPAQLAEECGVSYATICNRLKEARGRMQAGQAVKDIKEQVQELLAAIDTRTSNPKLFKQKVLEMKGLLSTQE